MSSRYYFNPFAPKPLMQELKDEPEDKITVSYINNFKKPLSDFLSKEDIYTFLELLLKTQRCFGKFDLFNKWRICSIKINDGHTSKQMQSRLRHVMLKTYTYCTKCSHLERCSSVRISLDELQTIWDDLYFSKGSIFNPTP